LQRIIGEGCPPLIKGKMFPLSKREEFSKKGVREKEVSDQLGKKEKEKGRETRGLLVKRIYKGRANENFQGDTESKEESFAGWIREKSIRARGQKKTPTAGFRLTTIGQGVRHQGGKGTNWPANEEKKNFCQRRKGKETATQKKKKNGSLFRTRKPFVIRAAV